MSTASSSRAANPISVFCPFRATPFVFLLFLSLAFLLSPSPSQGCGLPMAPAPAPTCCCGGCGGRKKREAIQPHYKGHEVPCPQVEWKQIIQGAIDSAEDQNSSLGAIQNALFRRFPNEKFLVICAMAHEQEENALATKIVETAKQLPEAIHFSSAGDGYCNVLQKGQWCQAVALSA